MGVNSLPKTVTRQRLDCILNPSPSAPESSTLTTRLPSHPLIRVAKYVFLLLKISKMIQMLVRWHRDGPLNPDFRLHQDRVRDYLWSVTNFN